MNGIPEHRGYDTNHIDSRSAVVFRENEFRTPSPLLPSWHQPFNSAVTYEDSNDDCYFHSSENTDSYLHQPDVKPVLYQSDSDAVRGSQVIAIDAFDKCHLRYENTHLAGNYSNRLIRTEETLDERTFAGSKSMNNRRPVVGRSKPTFIICFLICNCPFYISC